MLDKLYKDPPERNAQVERRLQQWLYWEDNSRKLLGKETAQQALQIESGLKSGPVRLILMGLPSQCRWGAAELDSFCGAIIASNNGNQSACGIRGNQTISTVLAVEMYEYWQKSDKEEI